MRKPSPKDARLLRQALAPYISVRKLRRIAAGQGFDLRDALLVDQPSPDVQALLEVIGAVLRPLPRDMITDPADVAALLMVEMGGLVQEQMRVVCLDSKHHVQTIHTVYQGNLHATIVRPSEIFREAVRRTSSSIILAHNHPSGDPTPSQDDVMMTQHVITVGELLDIPLIDHLVIGRGSWVSLHQLGLVG